MQYDVRPAFHHQASRLRYCGVELQPHSLSMYDVRLGRVNNLRSGFEVKKDT